MKSFIKYALLAVLFISIACGNTSAKKEKVIASTKPTIKETPKPVLEEKIVAETVEAELSPTIEKIKPSPAVPTKPTGSTNPKPIDKKPTKTPKPVTTVETKPITSTPATKVEMPSPIDTKEENPKKETPVEKEVKQEIEKTAPTVAVPPAPIEEEVKPSPAFFSHEAWDQLTQKHISSTGKVNYRGFKADIIAFKDYLKSLANNPPQSSWSKAKKMAYWINAYNAFTIKLIVDNYPVKSIMDLDGGKPWDRKWIKLGAKTYSLNNIEHDILRPTYKDARIHFAVNCAAKSCPPVWNKAWTEKNLSSQLERSAKSFINNNKYNSVGGNNATISKIFEWYAEDFGNIVEYLNKYATTKVAAGTTVKYQDYNWDLNE